MSYYDNDYIFYQLQCNPVYLGYKKGYLFCMKNIHKEILLQKLIEQAETELKLIAQAAQNTYDIATHEENKPENEYDTRGLEASYLASAQAERVNEMKDVIIIWKSLKVKSFTKTDVIALTALVECEIDGKSHEVFILPKGGGEKMRFEGHTLHVVTPESPLGEALIGLKVGDVAYLNAGGQEKEYEIIDVR